MRKLSNMINNSISLIDKIKNIKKTSKLKPLETDNAKDFDELWEKVIEPNLPNFECVKKWHNEILIPYINRIDAIFSMRIYGSPSGNSPALRRGFYNKTNYDFGAFYVDNFFTAYFYSMAFDGYFPIGGEKEFYEAIKGQKFPCGCIQTKVEDELAAYKRGTNPSISKKGYKIAHIFSAGKDYDPKCGFKTIGDFCEKFFPRGNRSEWKLGVDGLSRTIVFQSDKEAQQARDFLVAHFLRTVHPINYFLVPNKSNVYDTNTGVLKTNIYWYDNGVEKDEIGEDKDLIDYVASKIKNKYGVIFDQFYNRVFPNVVIPNMPTNKQIDAEYGIDIWKTHVTNVNAGSSVTKSSNNNNCRSNSTNSTNCPSLIIIPTNENDFKAELAKTGKAIITWKYDDGSEFKKPWTSKRIQNESSIRGNIQSRTEWRNKLKDGLVEVVVEIDYN